MKYLALLLIFGFGLSGFGQTIKSLGYNTANGQVVYSGTNALTFTNEIKVAAPSEFTRIVPFGFPNSSGINLIDQYIEDTNGIFGIGAEYGIGSFKMYVPISFYSNSIAATTRTNLGLGWSALTNTNASTSLLGFTTNGQVVANTGTNALMFTNNITLDAGGENMQFRITATGVAIFSGAAGEDILFIPNDDTPIFSPNYYWSEPSVRAAFGFSTNLNTLWTATNASNARSAVELGSANNVEFNEMRLTHKGDTNNVRPYLIGVDNQDGTELITIRSDNSGDLVSFLGGGGTVFQDTVAFGVAPTFEPQVAQTRTNLGLGWSALTNTNASTGLLGYQTNGIVQYSLSGVTPLIFSNSGSGDSRIKLISTITDDTLNLSVNTISHTNATGTNWIQFDTRTFNGAGGSSVSWTFNNPITFNNTTNREITRTNLGLGADSYVRFGSLAVQSPVGNIDSISFRMAGSPAWIDFTDEDVTRVPFGFSSEDLRAAARTNLGLQATWLTNTNTANFRTDIGLGTTNNVSFRSLSVRPAPLDPGVILNAPLGGWIDFSDESGAKDIFKFGGEVGRSLARSNLGLGTTNIVQFGNVFITNANAGSSTNYMLSIGAPDTGFTGVGGPAGAVNFRAGGTALWTASSSTGLEFGQGAKFRSTLDIVYGGGAFGVISFSGSDPDTGRAISRTNLGLGATWLTNTDVTNFRTDVGLGASNVVSFGPMFLQDQGTYTLALGNTNTGFRIIAGGASRYGFHKQGVLIWDIAATNDTFNVAVPMTFGQPATTRTNLGLGATWLTNTSVSNFRTAIGLGESDVVYFSEVGVGRGTDGYTMSGTAPQNNPNFGFSFKFSGSPFLTISNLLGTNGGALIFHGTVGAATTRTNLGLGGGITTNRTFVSYDGTNYTTNVVTISNGIITGWTQ